MSDLIFEFLALLLGVSNVIWSEKTKQGSFDYSAAFFCDVICLLPPPVSTKLSARNAVVKKGCEPVSCYHHRIETCLAGLFCPPNYIRALFFRVCVLFYTDFCHN